ncbi:MAG: alpha/beta hydrolase [Pseudomonadota bacterium]
MTVIEQTILVAASALLLGGLGAAVYFLTRPLPATGRWLARGLLLLAVGLPLALASCSPPELTSATPERETNVATKSARERNDTGSETAARRSTERTGQTRSATSQRQPGSGSIAVLPPAVPPREPSVRTRGLSPSPPKKSAQAASNENWDVVPVYYGTDRQRTSDALKAVTYGTERAKRLELGQALVTIPKIHQVPEIERPWVYRLPFTNVVIYEEKEDPKKHFTLQEVRALSQADFLKLVRERLAASARFKDHALIFVHGFNTSFNYALFRTAQLAYDLKFDGAPFVYSWPSQGRLEWYNYDRESAQQSEPYLEQFVRLVLRETNAKTVSVIAHSMGNQPLLRTLQKLKTRMPEGAKLSQVIFAAPDVDRDSFENLAREIQPVADGITLYAHGNDRALDVSRRFWGSPRAGDVPTGGPVILPGLDTIDVTATSTDIFNLNHSGYAENKALLNDIGLILQTGERPPSKRIPILQKVETDRGTYWRYPARR